MKTTVKIPGKVDNLTTKELIIALFSHFLSALLGFIASRAVLLDKLLPFGLGFLGGCPITYTPAAAIGCFLGYFIPLTQGSAFRYIAAVFAILAVKLLLTSYKKTLQNPAFLALASFLAASLTAAVSLKMGQIKFIELIAEGSLCAAAAFFTARSFKAFERFSQGLNHTELTEFLILSAFALSGFNSITLGGISLGGVLSVLFILISAKYGGVTAATVSGVTVALIGTLCGTSGGIGISLAFAGLIAGVFNTLGKYAQILCFLVFLLVGSISTGSVTLISKTVIEAAIGSALFLTVPKKTGIFLGKIFTVSAKVNVPEGLKKSLTIRLDLASDALKDVSHTVEQVSRELSKINSPDFGSVITAIEQDACKGCKLRIHCWETKRDSTVNALLEMTKAVKSGSCDPEEAAPEEFKGRCVRVNAVGNAAYKRYSDYASRIAAENRIEEVRSVVSDQFNGISQMLKELSTDFESDQQFDHAAAVNCAAALKGLGIHTVEAAAKIDKYGRMALEFKVKKTPELVINKAQVMRLLSALCERDFDVPTVREMGGEIFIVLNEKPEITIDIGVDQAIAEGSVMCGDAYKYFLDGRGHFIMLLSDGMGTGGRAAVDGAMASGLMARLIKAGFGYDCSLRILNSAMLFKSTDESLATVDIASIDLFTGETKLFKAGAAPTIIRRQGKTGKAESTSLPAGILREIGFDRATVKCRSGDIIVLMSDGASFSGTDWLRAEIEAFSDGTAQELAERLCSSAKRRRDDNHTDDVTVMVAILNKIV